MRSFDFDGNEFHIIVEALKIESLYAILFKDRVKLSKYRVIVSSVFLWLILSSDQAWVEYGLLLFIFKLRYVKN